MTKSTEDRITMEGVLRHPYLIGAAGHKDKWIYDFKVYKIFSQMKKSLSDDPLNDEEFDEEAAFA